MGQIGFFRVALRDRRIVGAALHAGTGADQHVIVVFKDENAPDVLITEVLREFPYRSAAVMLPVLLVLLLAGGLIVRRRMRPIAAASRLAETIGLDTLHIRLPQQEAPAELQPIIGAVNGAFDRLQQAVATQREFLRRAAHALRTPMAVLSARAGLVTDEETAGQLRTDVMELARIVSQFQQLNEIDALPVGSNAVADLCQVGETVRAETAAQAAARQIQLQLSHPEQPVRVRGEPHIIAVAARNLVENALQHAPCGGTVAIRIGEDGSIAVSDNGPGVPVELRGKIFEPFWSGDPDGRRIGLGLTVVRRIAERYGATVAVTGPASGGTTVALHFARPANAAGVAPV